MKASHKLFSNLFLPLEKNVIPGASLYKNSYFVTRQNKQTQNSMQRKNENGKLCD